MGLIPYATVMIDNPQIVYGLQASPRYSINEVLSDVFNDVDCTLTNGYLDSNAKVLTAQPTPIIADTTTSIWTVAASNSGGALTNRWNSVTDPITNSAALTMDDATAGVSFSALQTAAAINGLGVSTADDFANPVYDGFGYTVKLIRGAAAPSAAANAFTIWNLADNFRVYFAPGQPFQLQTTLETGEDAAWYTIRSSSNIPDSEAYLEANNRTAAFTFLYYPFRQTLSVYIGQGDDDISFGGFAPITGGWALYGQEGKCRFSFFSIGYPQSWSYQSGTKLTGLQLLTTPTMRLYPSPADIDLTGSTQQTASVYSGGIWTYANGQTLTLNVSPDPNVGPAVDYSLVGTNPVTGDATLSPYTSIVHRVQIDFPAKTYIGSVSRYQEFNPREVVETYKFDWNTMSATASAEVTFSNFHSELSGNVGMRAATITRGWLNTDTGQAWPYPSFYGWMGMNRSYQRRDPSRTAVFTIEDRSLPLRIRPCGILPWFDAWCPYAKLRMLYEIGSIVSDPASGYDWMMNLPNCSPGPNPPDCPHVLLPAGTGAYPRSKAAPDQSLWNEILKTSVDYRWLTGFDYTGQVYSEPYDPTTGVPYLGSMGDQGNNPFIFQGVPSIDYTGLPNLDEIVENFGASQSMQDIRTEVTLIGQDIADRSILIAHNADNRNDMLFNVDSPNFLGFDAPFFDINPEYIDQDYMNAKCALTAQQASIPTQDTSFNCWFQPNLYLFQVFGVYEPISLGNTVNYYRSTGLIHRYSVPAEIGGSFYARTSIEGKSVLNV